MTQRALSKKELDELMARMARSSAHKETWPSDEDLKRIAKAVKQELEEVEFVSGRKFVIKYSEQWDAVFVKPMSGEYTPCGYFNLDRLKEVLRSGAK